MSYLTDLAVEIRARVAADTEVPEDADDLFVVYALLARIKGQSVTDEDVHDAWVAWMTVRGQDHKSMVPFAELAEDVRQQDAPFTRAIRDAVRAR